MSNDLPPLKQFIIPGGQLYASQAHIARTVCRRCEVEIISLHEQEKIRHELIAYINRLSDWFFVLTRTFTRLFARNENYYQK